MCNVYREANAAPTLSTMNSNVPYVTMYIQGKLQKRIYQGKRAYDYDKKKYNYVLYRHDLEKHSESETRPVMPVIST